MCPFCGSVNQEGNRCLDCGMNKDSFNPPYVKKDIVKEPEPEIVEKPKKKKK
jgi:hypothetical protein